MISRIEYRDGRYYRDGEPLFFVGVDYQYYRDKRERWAARLDQIKESHANVVTFYIPWRHHLRHEERTGEIFYDFDGSTLDSRDVKRFMDLIAERGLYMVAKPGPFVHSELNIGGLPDVTSPSYNPAIEPVRMFDGKPLTWEYDGTQLPSPNDPVFDALAAEWLRRVGEILRPHASPGGNLIGIQLNDETLYCTSNDPPWAFGYDAADMRFFQDMLRAKYRTINAYNRTYGIALRSFHQAKIPRLLLGGDARSGHLEASAYIDWAELQWRLRRDFYQRYKEALNVELPYLTNFAGITPPIEENVPDQKVLEGKEVPPSHTHLYPEWWLAMNRVDADADVYHYGMISWLGVAAYNIADASSEPGEIGDNDVFYRYINTSRRRRGINMEENWGFSHLYHPLSEYPVIPFFQTLASIAGGCTGYVVFTGVQHDYWPDELDGETKKQQPRFPMDAPIGPEGETGAMYDAMELLNRWFRVEGGRLLRAEPRTDVVFVIVPEYAAVSSWVPSDSEWKPDNAVPRCGTGVMEPAARTFCRNGVGFSFVEAEHLESGEGAPAKTACVHLAYFLSEKAQRRLVGFAEEGGSIVASGELPVLDERMKACRILHDYAKAFPDRIRFREGNLFDDETALVAALREAGWSKTVSCSNGLHAFVHTGGGNDFVFFFGFDRDEGAEHFVNWDGGRLDLTLGAKTCGVVRVVNGRMASYLVKGVNEFEKTKSRIVLRMKKQVIEVDGDGAAFDL